MKRDHDTGARCRETSIMLVSWEESEAAQGADHRSEVPNPRDNRQGLGIHQRTAADGKASLWRRIRVIADFLRLPDKEADGRSSRRRPIWPRMSLQSPLYRGPHPPLDPFPVDESRADHSDQRCAASTVKCGAGLPVTPESPGGKRKC